MDNPLHAKFYADSAGHYEVTVTERVELAHDTYLVRLACPDLAKRITPGQFIMIRQATGADPLLGRAFAMYDVIDDASGQPTAIDIVFHTVGKMTALLAEATTGDAFQVWGPLGNGFDFESAHSTEPIEHLIMVAGGIGQTPFLALAKECLGIRKYGERVPTTIKRVTLCYGARSADYLAGVAEFEAAGAEVRIATDDGSTGHHGLVTDVLAASIDDAMQTNSTASIRLACCGPERMMEAVAAFAMNKDLTCDVSLETPMACGLGICFSCVTRVKQADGSWDFKRTCVDGPVFEADQLAW